MSRGLDPDLRWALNSALSNGRRIIISIQLPLKYMALMSASTVLGLGGFVNTFGMRPRVFSETNELIIDCAPPVLNAISDRLTIATE